MADEFTVTLDDTPGSLARLGGILGDARVNLEAIHGTSREGKSVVHFIPDRADQAVRALTVAGVAYTRREVLTLKILDEPGTLGEVALVMAKANINIDSLYLTTHGHVVFGVDDLAGATHVAAGMAVMPL
jgi:hypothetical protein